MSQEFKYRAIILGKRDVLETDRLYILYTQEKGKVVILGKGVRKPNAKLAGNLETLNFSEVFVSQGRGRGNITGVVNVESFLNIRASQEVMERVFYVLGLFQKLIEPEEKDLEIFDLFLEYLKVLDENASLGEDFLDILTQGFVFKFLDCLGYKLEIKKCVACGSSLKLENNFLSLSEGGVVCQKCSRNKINKILLSNNVIKILRIFSKNELRSFEKLRIQEKDLKCLKNALGRFVSWIA